jgi:hypothetical protein
MTLLGLLALACAGYGLLTRRPVFVAVALGFGAGVPASAGVLVGGLAVPVFTCVALLAVTAVVAGAAPAPGQRRWRAPVAVSFLVAFAVWSVAVTGLAPWAFDGIPVLLPRLGIDEQVGAPSALTYSISNLAQPAYLCSALVAVVFLARTGTARTALVVAAWTGIGLSVVRSVLTMLGLDVFGGVFDTLGVDYSSGGDGRWRGVFSEPSELASFALAVAALAIAGAVTSSGRRRTVRIWLAVFAAVALLASASGTAVVASGIAIGTAALVAVARFLLNGGRHVPWFVLGAISIACVVLAGGETLTAPITDLVRDKLGSQSFDSRSAADAIGLHVFTDTWGFGAGLGSNRSSSFAVSLLATVGAAGVVLFVLAVLALVRDAARARATVPAMVGLLALLVAKSVATPDLSTPMLWLLVSGCVVMREVTKAPGPLGERELVHHA